MLILGALAIGQSSVCAAEPKPLTYKEHFIGALAHKVPEILQSQDPKTGRFGKGIWIVNDQHPIFPLAVAWATQSQDNPYYHDAKILKAIMAGGDALIDDQAPNGQWEFRKKDGSTWGPIYQPWTYSRWIRAYALVRDAMPPDRRKRWDDALTLGFTGIAKTQLTRPVNIPAHLAMALYIAGQLFDKPEWCAEAKAFLARVVAAQDPGGFWTEHYGPVVGYNSVYVDALGIYYSVSKDKTVLPALERAAKFHAAFTYPNGIKVETVDERNPYGGGFGIGNVGFTFTAEGRGLIAEQMARGKDVDADTLASFIINGEEGPALPTAAGARDRTWVSDDDKSMIRRKGDWFICISAYCCPVYEKRWIQDRQNFVSIYNDRVGLIIGGGNTKLQPLWSNFTVGDVSLLRHTPGDTAPKFTPPPGIVHVPSAAALEKADPPGLLLDYDGERCEIVAEPVNDKTLTVRLKATTRTSQPVAAHITLIPHTGHPFTSEHGAERLLNNEPFTLTSKELGAWIGHAGWKLSLPEGSTVTWPVEPHNPYTKDGASTPAAGRIVVTIPFSETKQEYVLTLTVQ